MMAAAAAIRFMPSCSLAAAVLLSLLCLLATKPVLHVSAAPLQQTFQATYAKALPYDIDPAYWALEEGVGHFSEWSKGTKRQFVDDVRDGKANEWVIVTGNEGGDLDSMTAALTWAYHISHLGLNETNQPLPPDEEKGHYHPHKAVALLQTPQDALDLRPENKLALHNVQMSPGHRDLLTIDELPLPAAELAKQIKGIILVDHPEPLSVWKDAKVLSIFDHHQDRGVAPHAKPRIFEGTASCTTIVAREMLNELEKLPQEYHMPHEVVELILDAIALDSDGLRKGTPEDKFTSRRLLKRSNWRDEKLLDVMDRLDNEMSKAKKDLEDLGVRDLLRRDWKGDMVKTKAQTQPQVHLGFASIPFSLDEQIQRTLHETTQSWFTIEQAWAEEIGADVSLSLHSYKIRKSIVDGQFVQHVENDDQDDDVLFQTGAVTPFKSTKVREIALVVRESDQLNAEAANSLFEHIKSTIDRSPFLDAEPWHSVKELTERQMVWTHHVPNGGRKLIRPIVEDAVKKWQG